MSNTDIITNEYIERVLWKINLKNDKLCFSNYPCYVKKWMELRYLKNALKKLFLILIELRNKLLRIISFLLLTPT